MIFFVCNINNDNFSSTCKRHENEAKKYGFLEICSFKLRFLWGTDLVSFYPGDLAIPTGDRDNLGELAYMQSENKGRGRDVIQLLGLS